MWIGIIIELTEANSLLAELVRGLSSTSSGPGFDSLWERISDWVKKFLSPFAGPVCQSTGKEAAQVGLRTVYGPGR